METPLQTSAPTGSDATMGASKMWTIVISANVLPDTADRTVTMP